MTKREILCALKSFITNPEVEFEKYFEDLTVEEAEAFIENEIELLDKRAASAKEAAAKKKAQGDELTEAVYNALTSDFEPIADIATRVGNPDATIAMITYRLSRLAKDGKIEKGEITVQAEGEKARKIVAYRAC